MKQVFRKGQGDWILGKTLKWKNKGIPLIGTGNSINFDHSVIVVIQANLYHI